MTLIPKFSLLRVYKSNDKAEEEVWFYIVPTWLSARILKNFDNLETCNVKAFYCTSLENYEKDQKKHDDVVYERFDWLKNNIPVAPIADDYTKEEYMALLAKYNVKDDEGLKKFEERDAARLSSSEHTEKHLAEVKDDASEAITTDQTLVKTGTKRKASSPLDELKLPSDKPERNLVDVELEKNHDAPIAEACSKQPLTEIIGNVASDADIGC